MSPCAVALAGRLLITAFLEERRRKHYNQGTSLTVMLPRLLLLPLLAAAQSLLATNYGFIIV